MLHLGGMDNLVAAPDTGLGMHDNGILMHMRTTMFLNETLLEEARRLTGLTEKTAIVHAGGLEASDRPRERTSPGRPGRLRSHGDRWPSSSADQARPPMTLVDTSIWANHLRRADPRLVRLLGDAQVVCHPFVGGVVASAA